MSLVLKTIKLPNKKSLHVKQHDVVNEEYDNLRKNIEFSILEHDIKTLLITSPKIGDGKSTIAANVAIFLAKSGKKVLLIDTNTKSPTLHNYFSVENNEGFTHVLINQLHLKNVVRQTKVKNLHLITSGSVPYSTQDLFKSNFLEEALEEAKHLYDVIIVDSPPILEREDTKIVSSKCDGVIIVIREGVTDQESAIEAKRSLQIVNAKIIGVIMNAKRNGQLKRPILF